MIAGYVVGLVVTAWIVAFVNARYWRSQHDTSTVIALAIVWPFVVFGAIVAVSGWLLTIVPHTLGETLRKREDESR